MTVQQSTPRGLSTDEIVLALRQHGANTIPTPRPPSTWLRVLAQLRDPMILLLIAAAVLTASLRDLTDLTVILVVVLLNTTVGVVQEIRAEHALAALNRLAAPQATVRPGGRTTIVPSAEVVPDDVLLLQAGDVVPADLRLFDAVRLQADESALTGESVPVEKDPTDELYAGTVVTRGRGQGAVTRTGSRSALGGIAVLLSKLRPRASPLQRRLAALSRMLGIAAVVLSAIVAVAGLIRGLPLPSIIVTAVSLTVAAVPESLPAVITLALAIGAHRMAQRAALVRKLPAVETLGSVTIVATDKTGTLTEGIMQAERLWTETSAATASGTGYDPAGDLEPRTDAVRQLLRDVALCNDAALRPPTDDDPVWRPIGDPTEAALLTLAHRGAADLGDLRVGRVPVSCAAAGQVGLVVGVQPCLRTRGPLVVVLVDKDVDAPAPAGDHGRISSDRSAVLVAIVGRRLPRHQGRPVHRPTGPPPLPNRTRPACAGNVRKEPAMSDIDKDRIQRDAQRTVARRTSTASRAFREPGRTLSTCLFSISRGGRVVCACAQLQQPAARCRCEAARDASHDVRLSTWTTERDAAVASPR